MANPALTRGSIRKMLTEEKMDDPIVQVLGCRKIDAAAATTDRFKVHLSDGEQHYSSCMMATQLNERLDQGELKPFALIKVTKHLLNKMPHTGKVPAGKPARKVLVLVDFVELKSGDKVGVKIGNPVPYDPDAAAPAPLSTGPTVGFNAVPKPTYGGGGIMGGGAAAMPQASATGAPPTNVFPIQSLTPYQSKWTIRVRVTNKNPIKTYTNARGEGKLFSCDLADESGEIRATCFNKEVDKFHMLLEPNGVYYISRGAIKPANKQYSSINNDYELTFTSETTISPCTDESNLKIPTVTFNFVKINLLPNIQKDKLVDVLGVVKSYGDVQTINSAKWGKEFQKRDLQLVDDSLAQVSLTLWGQMAVDFNNDNNPVMAVKGAKISDYSGGINLGAVTSSIIQFNPDIREAHILRGWYDSQGSSAAITSLAGTAGGSGDKSWQLMKIAFINATGDKEKPDYFTVIGTIMAFRKEQALYQACATAECKKKVIDLTNGMYRCEKCGKDMPMFKWRLMLQMCISDLSDSMWVSCFEEQAALILGHNSEELGMMKERDPEGFDKAFSAALFKKWTFRVRAKMETFNDENRIKYTVYQVTSFDFVEYSKYLSKEIGKLEMNDFS